MQVSDPRQMGKHGLYAYTMCKHTPRVLYRAVRVGAWVISSTHSAGHAFPPLRKRHKHRLLARPHLSLQPPTNCAHVFLFTELSMF